LLTVTIRLLFLLFACAFFGAASAQSQLKGTVYDSSHTYPLDAVSVMTTGGRGTVSNAAGAYQIDVTEKDSIWFSYLGKPTRKFAVKKITDLNQFDIALQVPVTVLREIRITPRNYRQDSLQNRADYAKAFDFQRPNLSTMTSIGPNGAGIDLDELIRVFQFRKNRSMAAFQKRLLLEEQEKFIDHRFSRQLVRRLTDLTGDDLEAFMLKYRPPYDFVLLTGDYDFQDYIRKSFRTFKEVKGF
jgi:hypothetical protein